MNTTEIRLVKRLCEELGMTSQYTNKERAFDGEQVFAGIFRECISRVIAIKAERRNFCQAWKKEVEMRQITLF